MEPEAMRLFAIGDIHGYARALETLLEAVGPRADDMLVFLGDYVDKGPDVAGTLELVSRLVRDHDWVFLLGNHDQMLIDAYRDPEKIDVWECLAGERPLASYGEGGSRELLRKIPAHHIRFLEERCRDVHSTEAFIFVHAGIGPGVDPEDEEVEHLHWNTLSTACPHGSGRTVICGHSSQASGRIVDLGHTVCIDTGITKGKFLTCLDLGDFTYVQASARGEIVRGVLRG